MKSLYSKRIVNFFKYIDNENNRRIFLSIKNDKKNNHLLVEIQTNDYIIIIFLLLLIINIMR